MEQLAQAGFICFGHDHFGHGHSVEKTRHLGHIDFKKGADVLKEDVASVAMYMQEQYPALPCVLFGHSMGSFVVRCVAARNGSLYRGVIACGTGGPNPALGAGKLLSSIISCLKGTHGYSDLLYGLMFGAYGKRFSDPSGFAWLNTDQVLVAEYEDDPLCGFPFTLGGIRTLLNLHGEANSKAIAQTPKTLPLLLIAGEDDPVGDYGEGVKKVSALYTEAGMQDVTCKLYAGRHEILNESVKEDVYADMLTFIQRVI